MVAAKGTIPSLLEVPILQTAGLMDIDTAPVSVRVRGHACSTSVAPLDP